MYGFTQQWDSQGEPPATSPIGRDIWIWAKAELTHACRLVIADVSEDDAHHIRAQWRSAEGFVRESGHTSARVQEVVQQIADRVVEVKSEQTYRNKFLAFLTDASNQFTHLDGAAVQIKGTFSSACDHLNADDVELIKQVWLRLPLKYQSWRQLTQLLRIKTVVEDMCPTCGNGPTAKARRVSPAKTRGDLRNRLAKLNEDYPREVFNAWAEARLRAGEFTVAADLYADYCKWAAKHGGNTSERKLSKETLLTLNRWGRLMVAGPYTPLRRSTGKGYRVALRRV